MGGDERVRCGRGRRGWWKEPQRREERKDAGARCGGATRALSLTILECLKDAKAERASGSRADKRGAKSRYSAASTRFENLLDHRGVLASPCITEMRTRSVSSGCVISVAKKSVA